MEKMPMEMACSQIRERDLLALLLILPKQSTQLALSLRKVHHMLLQLP